MATSGPIRSAIGPTKSRLTRHLDEAIRDYTVPEGTSNEEKLKKLKSMIETCESDIAKIDNALATLEKWNDRWILHIASLNPDKVPEEEKLYDKHATGDDGFLTLMDKASDASAVLQNKLEQLQREASRLSSILYPPTSSAASTSTAEVMNIQLPTSKLVEFDGNIAFWKTFWDVFSAAVHDRPLPNIQKLTYLLSVLRGDAKKAIAGYAVTAENYSVIIDILKKRFGDPKNILLALHSELKHIPKSGDRTSEVRRTFEQIERICRQLEDSGEDVEHQQIVMVIESKLPHWLLKEIYRQKLTDPSWSVKKLREYVNSVLYAQECMEKVERDNRPHAFRSNRPEQTRNFRDRNRRFTTNTEHRSSAFATTTSNPRKVRFSKNLPTYKGVRNRSRSNSVTRGGCYVCDGNHKADYCERYKSYEAKKKKAYEDRKCLKCLSRNHKTMDCRYSIPCYICKENHRPCMCEKRKPNFVPMRREPPDRRLSGVPRGPRFPNNRRSRTPVATRPNQGPARMINAVTTRQESVEEEEYNSNNENDEVFELENRVGQIVLSVVNRVGSRQAQQDCEVILPATRAIVQNPVTEKTAETYVLCDGGSDTSFIAKSLARHLNLKPVVV